MDIKNILLFIVMTVILSSSVLSYGVVCRNEVENCEDALNILSDVPDKLLQNLKYVELTDEDLPYDGIYNYMLFANKRGKIYQKKDMRIILYNMNSLNHEQLTYMLFHELGHHNDKSKYTQTSEVKEAYADNFAFNLMEQLYGKVIWDNKRVSNEI